MYKRPVRSRPLIIAGLLAVAACSSSSSSAPPAAPAESAAPPAPAAAAAPARPADPDSGLFFTARAGVTVLTATMSDRAARVVEAIGEVPIVRAEAHARRGRAPAIVSVHLETGADLDVAALHRPGDEPANIMFDTRAVDLSLEGDALVAEHITALAARCGLPDGMIDPGGSPLQSQHRLDGGVEQIALKLGPDAAGLLAWAEEHGVEVMVGRIPTAPPPGTDWRITVVDARPDGTGVFCARRID